VRTDNSHFPDTVYPEGQGQLTQMPLMTVQANRFKSNFMNCFNSSNICVSNNI